MFTQEIQDMDKYYWTWELLETQGAIDDHLAIIASQDDVGASMLIGEDVMISESVNMSAWYKTLYFPFTMN